MSALPSRKVFYLFVATFLFFAFCNNSFAALILVGTTTDSIANDGVCTLREAIISANTNTATGGCQAGESASTDTIILINGSTYSLTIAGSNEEASATGDLDILDNAAATDMIFSITGSLTATVQQNASPDDRVFDIFSGATVQMTGVIIQNANGIDGGGIRVSGASLTLTNCELSNNQATFGAGVYADASGSLFLSGTTVKNNTASFAGGGVMKGANAAGAVTIQNSTISGNTTTTDKGAGIYSTADLTILNSTITGNNATDKGGGIYHQGGTLTITNTTISNNTSATNGGGIDYNGGAATITGSVFRANTAIGNNGDAFAYENGNPPSITASCIIENGFAAFFNATLLTGIATGNWWGATNGPSIPGNGDTISGQWDVSGFLTAPTDSCTIIVTTNSDENNTDGDCSLREAVITSNTNAQVDQCFKGSNVYADWIRLANSGSYSLTISGAGEDAAATGDLDVTDNFSALDLIFKVASNGTATISQNAAPDDRVLQNIGAAIEVTGVTFQNGGNVTSGGGIHNSGSLVLYTQGIVSSNNATTSGGGIFNSGSLNIAGGSVNSNNATSQGGGIANTGTLTIGSGSVVSLNSSNNGGGISNSSSGAMTISGATISGNSATNQGGGIFSTSANTQTTINNGTLIYGNTADSGAGLSNDPQSTATIDASSIYGNDAVNNGGGILNAGTLTIQNGSVIGGSIQAGNNNTAVFGGGIFNYSTTPMTIDASTIGGNTATFGGGIANNNATITIQGNSTIGEVDPDFSNASTNIGGGIYNVNFAVMNILDSIVVGNNSDSDGGGIVNTNTAAVTLDGSFISLNHADFNGGGIMNYGTVMVTGTSVITTNNANNGGGIRNQGGSVTVEDSSLLINNSANGSVGSSGGGIHNGGTLTLQTGASVKDNSATNAGGGIFNDTSGTANISSSTIHNNSSNLAGGIHNQWILTIQDSTLSENSGAAGAIFHEGSSATITGTAIIENATTNGNGSAIYNLTNTLNSLSVTGSCISRNENTAAYNFVPASQTATGNWWGSGDGANPPGTGDTIFGPWDVLNPLTSPPAACRPAQLVYNGGFEMDTNLDLRPDGFTFSKMKSSDVMDCTVPADCVFKVKGNATTKKITDSILVSGSAGDSLDLSVDHKTSKVPSSGPMSFAVQFYQGTTLMQKETLTLTSGTHDWLTATKSITTNQSYDNVKIVFKFKKDKGTVYLDDLTLTLNP